MVASNADRTFAEVRPLFTRWLNEECVTPIEWAFDWAGIPVKYIEGLTGPYAFASESYGFAVVMLPETLREATSSARAAALRACVVQWEEGQHWPPARRIWHPLAEWVDWHEAIV